MPNGAPGDHPITDILIHGLDVYAPDVDALVREIVDLGGRDRIEKLLFTQYSPYCSPDVPKLRGVLTELRDRLVAEAKDRGWEVG
jgi:hypothetical protein